MLQKWIQLLLAICVLIMPVSSAYAQDISWMPFLLADDLPNGVHYLPPPPESQSPFYCLDENLYQWGKTIRSTPRGILAKENANFRTPYLAAVFSEPFGMEISYQKTPEIYILFARAIETAKQAVWHTKSYYKRVRPYAYYQEASGVPEHEEFIRKTASYPSGHTSMGWLAALVLVELNPGQAEQILKLGYEYGQSRVIVGYHFQSDVDAARMAASAAFARLQSDPGFMRQLARAKAEWMKLSAKDNTIKRDMAY